jgi:hypothetical protein
VVTGRPTAHRKDTGSRDISFTNKKPQPWDRGRFVDVVDLLIQTEGAAGFDRPMKSPGQRNRGYVCVIVRTRGIQAEGSAGVNPAIFSMARSSV